MKTNPSARRILKIRVIVLWLAIVGFVGVEFWAVEPVAARFGQTTARVSDAPMVPSVSISDMMTTLR